MNDEDRNIDWDNMSRAPGNAPDAGDGNIPSGTAERERQKRFDKLVLWLLATVLSFLLFSFTSLGPETWVGKSPMIHVLGSALVFVGLLLGVVLTAISWAFTGSPDALKWVVDLLPWGVNGPVRDMIGALGTALLLGVPLLFVLDVCAKSRSRCDVCQWALIYVAGLFILSAVLTAIDRHLIALIGRGFGYQ